MRGIFERLGRRELLLTVLQVVVVVSLFLPWHSYSILGLQGSSDGFHGWGLLSALGVLVTVWAMTAPERTRRIPLQRARNVGTALEFLGAALFLAIGPGAYHSDKVRAAFGPSYGVVVTFLAALASFLLTIRQGVSSNDA